jgi:diguanylate cyclase (GGDEF)-like protein
MKKLTHIELRILLPFLIVLLAIAGNAVVSYYSLHKLINAQLPVQHSLEIKDRLLRLSRHLLQAESSKRGFMLTQQLEYLTPYDSSLEQTHILIVELSSLTRDNPRQHKRLESLRALFLDKTAEMNRAIELTNAGKPQAALALLQRNTELHLMDNIRQLLDEMLNAEQESFDTHHQEVQNAIRWATVAVGMGIALNALLLVALYLRVAHALKDQHANEAALRKQNAELDLSLQQIEQYNLHSSKMSEMSKLLQVCNDLAEALKVVSTYLPPLLPNTSAGLYLFASSRNYLELVSTWGKSVFDRHILPEDCWAIRKGQVFYNRPSGGENHLGCAHERNGHMGCCIPLMAQGEIVGLFTLHYQSDSGEPPDASLLASICEHISLAISNIKLKAALKLQSIKDPLTGLNNRRLFEDALNRELARLTRTGKPLALIMMDIDHFKHFNDTYGHDAGDLVLREVAHALDGITRTSDVVCRYGGEEFCMLLPEAGPQAALDKAQLLRERIAMIKPHFDGNRLEMVVTMSFGVAIAPWHGDSIEQLVREADIALYKAKSTGRNRVVLAPLPPEVTAGVV